MEVPRLGRLQGGTKRLRCILQRGLSSGMLVELWHAQVLWASQKVEGLSTCLKTRNLGLLFGPTENPTVFLVSIFTASNPPPPRLHGLGKQEQICLYQLQVLHVRRVRHVTPKEQELSGGKLSGKPPNHLESVTSR